MEREGRGREGREMRRGRRGILIGGMVLGLLMGCNNGIAELEKKNKFLEFVVNLGNEFLNIFTSFADVFSSSLGFKEEPKKSDVANYFDKLKGTVQGTKDRLNEIMNNMEKEGNPNAAAVKTKVEALIKDKLNNIIEGAKTASGAIDTSGSESLGNVATARTLPAGAKADESSVKSLVGGIEKIVDVVLKNKGKATAGDNKKAEDGNAARGNNDNDAGKLFASDDAGANAVAKKAATDAAKAVGAVTGADILQAIISEGDSGKAASLAKNNNGKSNVADAANATDATVAGAIALRAMANKGKFANASDDDNGIVAPIVKRAASAVTKALDTLTIAIRNTIDEGLKEVKEAMKINPETTPVNSEGTINK